MSSERILQASNAHVDHPRNLYSAQALRALEQHCTQQLPEHTLMQRAGLACARWALAMAPHAHTYWIACGPGNNGGDGLEAALWLKAWGKHPLVSLLPCTQRPADAERSLARARAAGVVVQDQAPQSFDAVVEALFGLGGQRPLQGMGADWVERINRSTVPVLAIDVPCGLDADHGTAHAVHVRAHATLTLLGLKPGLFTAQGRDACGDIWLDTLGTSPQADTACATLNAHPSPSMRPHDSHKGRFGDVAVLGGASGMVGAAVLAARAALHHGAGRVYLALLAPDAPRWDPEQPEIMLRSPERIDWSACTTVAGCGAGAALGPLLEQVLAQTTRLVLDADALNTVAENPVLQERLRARGAQHTVLTPHPLEAARLLRCTTAQVQASRLSAAQRLADSTQCTVVLKGSGSVLAQPHGTPCINPTGNARLSSPGTGDVLAGMLGAHWAQGAKVWDAARAAVYLHGAAAHQGNSPVLCASALAQC